MTLDTFGVTGMGLGMGGVGGGGGSSLMNSKSSSSSSEAMLRSELEMEMVSCGWLLLVDARLFLGGFAEMKKIELMLFGG